MWKATAEPFIINMIYPHLRLVGHFTMYNWLDFVSESKGIKINHRLNNGKEKRVGPYLVDGYDPRNNVIYEFHGCYVHGHDPAHCPLTQKISSESWIGRQPTLLRKTIERTAFLEKEGFEVKEMWECRYNVEYKPRIGGNSKYLPPYCQNNENKTLSKDDICNAVKSGELFGMIECDIGVPKTWSKGFEKEISPYDYFSEMSPLFCTTDLDYNDLSKVMADHVQNSQMKFKTKRLLVGGMYAKKILIASPLLKWYIDHGMEVCNRIYSQ